MNCKKIEKQITHMFDNTNKLKEKQINDESHLQEHNNAVDFITKKFDTYKHEIKERKEIINYLTENVSRLAQKVDKLSGAAEKQGQYSRRNCLLLQEIPEKKQENTDKMYTKARNEHLDLAINNRNIDRKHRIGNQT